MVARCHDAACAHWLYSTLRRLRAITLSVSVVCCLTAQVHAERRTSRRHPGTTDKALDTLVDNQPSPAALPIGSSAPDISRDNADALPENALPALPEVPRLESTQPTAEDIQELSAKMNRLFADDADAIDTALSDLVEIRPPLVAAIRQRLGQLAERAEKERMKRIFSDARQDTHAKRNVGSHDGSAAASASDNTVLRALLFLPHPKDAAWRDCVALAAMLRMLSAAGTVEGARELVTAYAKFGEFIRVEVQQRLADMRDRALGALIEARRHPAEKIARWASLRLDQMGRAIPSEAVRTSDFEALADVLRAYGRVRDPDAARIIVSFANSERSQLRMAARQSIVLLGSVGMWQLRDAYEDVVGRRPRRDWTWERTARELFGQFDRLRLARVYGLFVQGQKHLEQGELEPMAQAYDLVLAKDPLFEKRALMAPGYFRLAQQLKQRDADAALQLLTRVDRISSDPNLTKQAQSLTLTLLAQKATARGMVDVDRLTVAVELDPGNQQAKESLARLQPGSLMNQYTSVRWVASAVIAVAGLLAVLLVLIRQSNKTPEPTDPKGGA